MSVSPEVMQANGGKPPPGAPPGAAPEQPPAAAPMMSPQKPEGAQEDSKVNCLLAQKLLEKALPAFGSGAEEGKAILKAISALAKAFGKQESSTEELTPAEKMQMLQGLAGPGAPPKPPQGAPPPPGAGAQPPQPPPGA
jgi:hypothetical protein